MWAFWAKKMLQQALNCCPKCNKSPNLATLSAMASQENYLKFAKVFRMLRLRLHKRSPRERRRTRTIERILTNKKLFKMLLLMMMKVRSNVFNNVGK